MLSRSPRWNNESTSPLNISYISFLPKKLTYFHIMSWSTDICNSSNLKFQLLQAFLCCNKWLKWVWWFMYENYFLKKYMKNHNFFFFFNKVEEKKIIEETFIPLLGLKYIYWGFTAFIVFMIKLANLELNFQCLSWSLSLTY